MASFTRASVLRLAKIAPVVVLATTPPVLATVSPVTLEQLAKVSKKCLKTKSHTQSLIIYFYN